MANCCSFNVKISGKEESCAAFNKMLMTEESWAIVEVELQHIGLENGNVVMEFSGECKWSVLWAMDRREENRKTLKTESKRLSLEIEVYSIESGMQFAEHIHYKNGDLLIDDCVDYKEYYWDKYDYPTISDYNEYHATTFTEKDFDEDGYHYEGGFDNCAFFTAA